ncbi:MAG: hypothetical protein EOP22_13570 [Hyphomicrobiales bacterium]|nr:MAG: hypothetical protein EOP22_13570 [Hyphomicrobiales bacterium]
MFASRGFRLSALFIALLTVFSVVAVDTAEARRGGSFGSRGVRTQQAAPATQTSPGVTAPVQRSMTAPTANRGGIAATTPAQRAGWFGGGIGGMLLGGLLFGGMFGLLFGTGFGGFGGMLALLAQVVIIGLLLSWFLGRRRQPAMAGAGNASPYQARQDWQPGGGTAAQPRANASSASQRAGRRDEIGISDRDLQSFQQRLEELQSAYSGEDYEALRRITTPEMMGYLAEELGSNASKGVRNEVFDVKLLSGDISEAWREGNDAYATVALRYESRDIVRDRASGQIVSGEDSVTPVTELWTFVRTGTGPWLVSAIQETN